MAKRDICEHCSRVDGPHRAGCLRQRLPKTYDDFKEQADWIVMHYDNLMPASPCPLFRPSGTRPQPLMSIGLLRYYDMVWGGICKRTNVTT